jgi:hypothetical protein
MLGMPVHWRFEQTQIPCLLTFCLTEKSDSKPWNTKRPRYLYSISTNTTIRLCKLHVYDFTAIKKTFHEISTMGSFKSISGTDFPVFALLSPSTGPGLSLSPPADEYPTMDIYTFHNIGESVQELETLRIGLGPSTVEKKHRRIHNCSKCHEAAWANAYFVEAMKIEKQTQKSKHKQPQHSVLGKFSEEATYSSNEIAQGNGKDTGLEGTILSLALLSHAVGRNAG